MPRKPNTDKHIRYFDSFPSRLRQLMQEHGTTQEEMKTVLNLATRQAVTGYVDGRISPSVDKLTAIADYYGVSADWLLGLAASPTREGDAQTAENWTGLSPAAVQCLHEEAASYEVSSGSCLSDLSMLLECPGFLRLIDGVDDLRHFHSRAAAAVETLSAFDAPPDPADRPDEAEEFFSALSDLRESFGPLRMQYFELTEQWSSLLDGLFLYRELVSDAKELLKRFGEV